MLKFVVFAVSLLVVNIALLWTGAFSAVEQWMPFSEPTARIEQEVVDVFMFTLRDEVLKKGQMPVEGLTPAAYLAVLPGLVATDFDGVQSQIGHYAYIKGDLVHIQNRGQLVNQSAYIVTRPGMERLLQNVLNRTGLDITADDTITDVIMTVIEDAGT